LLVPYKKNLHLCVVGLHAL